MFARLLTTFLKSSGHDHLDRDSGSHSAPLAPTPGVCEDAVVQRPTMRMSGPTLDATDPIALAEFYERLLGWPIVDSEGPQPGNPAGDGWAMLRNPDGSEKIEVQWEPHHRPPVWPPVEGEPTMMIHLDIGVADIDAGEAWAIAQGARLADHQPQEDVRVLIDPEGHPFCLFSDPTL